uniref:Uncharacterized protein n=1 Tax=Physcomitrium patens TaxID=3218 RepID=A0A2K1IYM1_PHYPA|nr:hypothetical protein PHYPA_024196 [Physcomitrium patens]
MIHRHRKSCFAVEEDRDSGWSFLKATGAYNMDQSPMKMNLGVGAHQTEEKNELPQKLWWLLRTLCLSLSFAPVITHMFSLLNHYHFRTMLSHVGGVRDKIAIHAGSDVKFAIVTFISNNGSLSCVYSDCIRRNCLFLKWFGKLNCSWLQIDNV